MPQLHRPLYTDDGKDYADWLKLRFYRALPTLEDHAIAGRAKAVSHRGFHVCSAALLVAADGATHEVVGANNKPDPSERNRALGHVCGEELNIEDAQRTASVVVGFVVAAPHQADDFSRIDLGVTISCGYCRRIFESELAKPEGVIKPFTRLVYVNVENRHRVDLPVSGLLALCKNGKKS